MLNKATKDRSEIRFSICSTGFKTKSVEEVISIAVRLGVNGVELWTGHLEEYEQRGGTPDSLNQLLTHNQLSVPMLSGYTYFSKSREEFYEELVSIQTAVNWAQALGCPRIRTFAGHLPSGEAKEEHWERTIEGLSIASRQCQSVDVKLAVEIHNNTLADRENKIAELLEAIDEPGLELIYDGFNLHVDQLDPLPVLERFISVISHVHVKNYKWNHENWSASIPVPVFQGDTDHRLIVSKLLYARYAGFISFEYFGDPDHVIRLTGESLVEIQNYIQQHPHISPR